MAIAAQRVRDGLSEVLVVMAPGALYLGVFAVQREPGGIMIEAGVTRDRSPARSRVATLAGAGKLRFLKCAAMRIVVTIRTGRECQALVFRGRLAWFRPVAFLARNVGVQSG